MLIQSLHAQTFSSSTLILLVSFILGLATSVYASKEHLMSYHKPVKNKRQLLSLMEVWLYYPHRKRNAFVCTENNTVLAHVDV